MTGNFHPHPALPPSRGKEESERPAVAEKLIGIESLDNEGRGVGHADGKVIFVEGALTGERVTYASHRKKASYELADVVRVLDASPSRVTPRCPHFGTCGGCSMQHADAATQVAAKQRVLEDSLWHIARLRPETIARALRGPAWNYRFRARLSVRDVAKKGGVLVGFHERKSSYVADMRECHVMPHHVSDLLVPLRELVGSLSIRQRLPQIEVAIGEGEVDRGATTALVLRILEPLTREDEEKLAAFEKRHDVWFWLQSKGPETARPLHAEGSRETPELVYRLPEFGLCLPFTPVDFTQVNPFINRSLVGRAVRLLAPHPGDRVVDLFCGLGNFTLPIATIARAVLGIDGSASLTQKARANAERNGLAAKTMFSTSNLFEANAAQFEALGQVDRALIDPPREGAIAVAKAFVALGSAAPERIVYVSCNPATLARDAAVLAHEGGYALREAGIVNMFPQTSHVESIALFERRK